MILASKQKKVKELPELFTDINNPRNELLLTVIYILELLGIRKFPDEFGKTVLFSYIQNNLNNYSLQEFREAFELGISGKLDFNVCEYQRFEPQFSSVYLENIMQSYSRFLSGVLRAMEKAKEEKEELEHGYKVVQSQIIDLWQKYKNDGEWYVYSFSFDKYDELLRLRILKKVKRHEKRLKVKEFYEKCKKDNIDLEKLIKQKIGNE